jgi:hypothetical protein
MKKRAFFMIWSELAELFTSTCPTRQSLLNILDLSTILCNSKKNNFYNFLNKSGMWAAVLSNSPIYSLAIFFIHSPNHFPDSVADMGR